jgi:hypothetical protein
VVGISAKRKAFGFSGMQEGLVSSFDAKKRVCFAGSQSTHITGFNHPKKNEKLRKKNIPAKYFLKPLSCGIL